MNSNKVYRCHSVFWDGPNRGKPMVATNDADFVNVLPLAFQWVGDVFQQASLQPAIEYFLGQIRYYIPDKKSTSAVLLDIGPGEGWCVCPPPSSAGPTWYPTNASVIQSIVRAIRREYPLLEIHWFFAVPENLTGFADGFRQLASLGAFAGVDRVGLELYHSHEETSDFRLSSSLPGTYAPKGRFYSYAAGAAYAARLSGVPCAAYHHHKRAVISGDEDIGPAVPADQFIQGVRATAQYMPSAFWAALECDPGKPNTDVGPALARFSLETEELYHNILIRPAREASLSAQVASMAAPAAA